ncbi:hypothetical protein BD779DRAFT_1790187 [Infundibulicybe gibba]|nr:hypothetical protein BD779DRAFT_1790187 [Infundibulicybe gibba]
MTLLSLEHVLLQKTPLTDPADGADESSGDEDGGLNWTNLVTNAARPVIPKRGEKDFERHQAGSLDYSFPAGHHLCLRSCNTKNQEEAQRQMSPYPIFYNIYKPSTPSKKSAPPAFDFQVVNFTQLPPPMPRQCKLPSSQLAPRSTAPAPAPAPAPARPQPFIWWLFSWALRKRPSPTQLWRASQIRSWAEGGGKDDIIAVVGRGESGSFSWAGRVHGVARVLTRSRGSVWRLSSPSASMTPKNDLRDTPRRVDNPNSRLHSNVLLNPIPGSTTTSHLLTPPSLYDSFNPSPELYLDIGQNRVAVIHIFPRIAPGCINIIDAVRARQDGSLRYLMAEGIARSAHSLNNWHDARELLFDVDERGAWARRVPANINYECTRSHGGACVSERVAGVLCVAPSEKESDVVFSVAMRRVQWGCCTRPPVLKGGWGQYMSVSATRSEGVGAGRGAPEGYTPHDVALSTQIKNKNHTTSPPPSSTPTLRRLDAKGLIYNGDYSGWYSITDECFYTNSQVIQTPSQGASPPTALSTETGSIILQSGPLADLSISRPRSRLGWGVQVPGDPEQMVYAWFDALLVYLTGRGFPWSANGRQEGWPADLQLPRALPPYYPPRPRGSLQKRLLAHAHWTVEQKNMSKSLGNVADPFKVIREHGLNVARYYLARVGGRFWDDVDWSQGQPGKHNKEIQSLLGNFLIWITSVTIQKRMAGAPWLALDALVGGENAALVRAQDDLPGKGGVPG